MDSTNHKIGRCAPHFVNNMSVHLYAGRPECPSFIISFIYEPKQEREKKSNEYGNHHIFKTFDLPGLLSL